MRRSSPQLPPISVRALLQRERIWPQKSGIDVSWTIRQETNGVIPAILTGDSAGMAFSLALAKLLSRGKDDAWANLPLHGLAATGAVTADGGFGEVGSTPAKIRGAVRDRFPRITVVALAEANFREKDEIPLGHRAPQLLTFHPAKTRSVGQ